MYGGEVLARLGLQPCSEFCDELVQISTEGAVGADSCGRTRVSIAPPGLKTVGGLRFGAVGHRAKGLCPPPTIALIWLGPAEPLPFICSAPGSNVNTISVSGRPVICVENTGAKKQALSG